MPHADWTAVGTPLCPYGIAYRRAASQRELWGEARRVLSAAPGKWWIHDCPTQRVFGPEHAYPHYRGTSLIRNQLLLGPYSRTMPRVLWLY
jgi:hypothetical protein